jgi:tetraacyldisaccharide 4'-kinase
VLTATERARLARRWRAGLTGPWRGLLVPLSLAYRAGLFAREGIWASGLLRRGRLPCAVVSVGNLAVGGTGKTPLCEWVVRRLASQGHRVAVVSRGYGRRAERTLAVVSDEERVLVGVDRAGDEPVLLAGRLPGVPVVVGRDRLAAGALARARFAPDVLVLDDGFQQRRLRVDVDLVCVDARAPWDAGLLPSGTLREPPAALRRADLIVLTRADEVGDLGPVRAEVRRRAGERPVVTARFEVEGLRDLASGSRHPITALAGRAVLAFAGIAEPHGLARLLAAHGVPPRDLLAFPDHHRYDTGDVRSLATRARAVGADLLVTTEKDAVRLPPGGDVPTWALGVRLTLDADAEPWTEAFDRCVEAALAGSAARR